MMNIRSGLILLTVIIATLPTWVLGEPQDDQALVNKLQPFIKCINRHSERASSSHGRYLSWIKKPAKGPTGRERVIYGLYTLYDPADCVAGISVASAIDPRIDELETAGTDYASALQSLVKITEEANQYYELEDYRDDKMKRGKAMHPALMTAYEDFDKADTRLRSAVTHANDALQLRSLQRIEAEHGRNLDYHVSNLVIRAKILVRAGGSGSLKSINLDIYQPALDAYTTAYQDLRSFSSEHPDVIKGVSMFSFFESKALEYLKTGKKLGRYVRDGHRWTSGERMMLEGGDTTWMVEGHPGRLVYDYNNLIDWANRLR